MRRLRDVLNPQDLIHLRQILGGKEEPNPDETMRRSKVKHISTDLTYVSGQSVEALECNKVDTCDAPIFPRHNGRSVLPSQPAVEGSKSHHIFRP